MLGFGPLSFGRMGFGSFNRVGLEPRAAVLRPAPSSELSSISLGLSARREAVGRRERPASRGRDGSATAANGSTPPSSGAGSDRKECQARECDRPQKRPGVVGKSAELSAEPRGAVSRPTRPAREPDQRRTAARSGEPRALEAGVHDTRVRRPSPCAARERAQRVEELPSRESDLRELRRDATCAREQEQCLGSELGVSCIGRIVVQTSGVIERASRLGQTPCVQPSSQPTRPAPFAWNGSSRAFVRLGSDSDLLVEQLYGPPCPHAEALGSRSAGRPGRRESSPRPACAPFSSAPLAYAPSSCAQWSPVKSASTACASYGAISRERLAARGILPHLVASRCRVSPRHGLPPPVLRSAILRSAVSRGANSMSAMGANRGCAGRPRRYPGSRRARPEISNRGATRGDDDGGHDERGHGINQDDPAPGPSSRRWCSRIDGARSAAGASAAGRVLRAAAGSAVAIVQSAGARALGPARVGVCAPRQVGRGALQNAEAPNIASRRERTSRARGVARRKRRAASRPDAAGRAPSRPSRAPGWTRAACGCATPRSGSHAMVHAGHFSTRRISARRISARCISARRISARCIARVGLCWRRSVRRIAPASTVIAQSRNGCRRQVRRGYSHVCRARAVAPRTEVSKTHLPGRLAKPQSPREGYDFSLSEPSSQPIGRPSPRSERRQKVSIEARNLANSPAPSCPDPTGAFSSSLNRCQRL